MVETAKSEIGNVPFEYYLQECWPEKIIPPEYCACFILIYSLEDLIENEAHEDVAGDSKN